MKRVRLRVLGGRCLDGDQPISVGVPLPLGFVTAAARWVVSCGDQEMWPVQAKPLAAWPDGSVKWLLAVFRVSQPTGEPLRLELHPVEVAEDGKPQDRTLRAVRARSEAAGVTIQTGDGELWIVRGQDRLFCESGNRDPRWLGPLGCRLLVTDFRGRQETAWIDSLRVVESGPVRVQVAIGGKLGRRTGLRFSGDLSFYAGSNLIRVRTTLENPRRARHPGGYWDLGDPGSILLQDLSVELATVAYTDRRIDWLEEVAARSMTTSGDLLEIYQDSSGGENWRSRNHINRDGRIPMRFQGYRVRTQDRESHGLRASPVVSLSWDRQCVSLALEEFWQQFPSAVEVRGERLTARLLPGQFGDLHELQAGEHNTRVLWIELGSRDGATACHRLSWIHDPPVAIPELAETAASGALAFFPTPEAVRRSELHLLLEDALNGDKSLFTKRELVDEFGWRHFGDMWADHEGAYSPDLSPVISHYNNQYDLLNGLLVQLLATGDRRWWQLAGPLARHVMDIDIYHTDRDKPAYNRGLFWHTAHYLDAGRSTHRTMSTAMLRKPMPAPGGGPGSEHNYTSGLLLYHYLTGCLQAKEAVLSLADWVVAMDDGARHVFGVLSDTPTGNASRTGDYHGPGRGAGNSINALLDAWLVTGSEHYIVKLEKLIRRTIHPCDDVESLNLRNAELRWSYTVHLQALFRFLELTESCPELDDLRAYTRAALLRYGQWMAANERFYLDEPEKLEYPTETWAAAELIKGTTLLMVARYASSTERDRFSMKGLEILTRGWQTLLSFDSRHFTRPLALALQQGSMESCLAVDQLPSDEVETAGGSNGDTSFGPISQFVDQREHLRSLAVSPWKLLGSLQHATRPSRWLNVARQTWVFERLRRWSDALGRD
ncbi:MAG: hypothetical protein WBQ27_03175 [Thermoanaerobaculia bacterium]